MDFLEILAGLVCVVAPLWLLLVYWPLSVTSRRQTDEALKKARSEWRQEMFALRREFEAKLEAERKRGAFTGAQVSEQTAEQPAAQESAARPDVQTAPEPDVPAPTPEPEIKPTRAQEPVPEPERPQFLTALPLELKSEKTQEPEIELISEPEPTPQPIAEPAPEQAAETAQFQAPKPLIPPQAAAKPEQASNAPKTRVPSFEEKYLKHEAKQERGKLALDSLEQVVGRKILSWVGVALFVLAGAFFVQLAVSKGWLNPQCRLGILAAAGLAFLAFGWRVFKHGSKRFSEVLNSAGTITFIIAGYYAYVAEVVPWDVSAFIMVAAVFFGFLLAGLYRSATLGFVVSLGGLAVPFLISEDAGPGALAIYLDVFFCAAIALTNWLKRSRVAVAPWAGAFTLMAIKAASAAAPAEQVDSFVPVVGFFAVFFLIDLVDLGALVLKRTRDPGVPDLVRACVTPLLCFAAFWEICGDYDGCYIGQDLASDWFDKYSGYLAFALAAVYGALAFAAAKKLRAAGTSERADVWLAERDARNTERFFDLRELFLIVLFAFVAVGVVKTFSDSFASSGFLALSTGLLILAARKIAAFKLPEFVAGIESEGTRERVTRSFTRASVFATSTLAGWAAVYFAIGAGLLLVHNLYWRLYPVGEFLELVDGKFADVFAVPFFHASAFPTTLGALIALAGLIAAAKLDAVRKDPVPRPGANEFFRTVLALARFMALASGVVGGFALLQLTASELYSYASARALTAEIARPGLVGRLAVVLSWLLAAAALFTFGALRKKNGFVFGGCLVLLVAVVKLGFVDLPGHPLFSSRNVPPLLLDPRDVGDSMCQHIGSIPSEAALPLWNLYSIPFAVAAALAIAFGVWLRLANRGQETDAAKRDALSGMTLGLFGAAFLLAIASLDLSQWFVFRTDRFPHPWFYAHHALWILWLVYAALAWTVGRLAKSAPIRWFAYFILAIELPYIFTGEFLNGEWRVDYKTVDSLLNVYALPTAAYFVALLALRPLVARVPNVGKNESFLGAVSGIVGLLGILVLLSFETYRYFTGKTWFGPGDWTRLFGLTVLWGIGAFLFAVLGRNVKTKGATLLCDLLSACFLVLLLGKFFLFDSTKIDVFRGELPFFHTYGASMLFICGTFAAIAYYYRRIADGVAHGDNTDPQDLEMARFKRNLALGLSIVAIGQVWLGSSIDVWNSARFFPVKGAVETNFLAQAALSVLWSVFAAGLLFFGFRLKKSWLRWSALGLFGLTTVKALTVDMSYLPSGYRVVAIFVLAVAVMLASAAYWKRAK